MSDVLVAMSGGVDSTVAAALLVEQGHNVVGVTLKLWSGDSTCCSVSDVDDARRVAHQLEIEHHVFNFGDDFETHVYQPYIDAYKNLEMPNPCIECNRHIKFDKLFRRADALGFETIATGHHARVVTQGNHFYVARGADHHKDQSYVIHMLDQTQLTRLMLPVGELTKAEVRRKAEDLGLYTADKPDSQNVCFIPTEPEDDAVTSRQKFLRQHIPLRSARIVDSATDTTIGETESLELLSIGQRKGLGLGGNSTRRYVIDRNAASGVVTVGSREELLVVSQPLHEVSWTVQPTSKELTIQASAHGARIVGHINESTLMWQKPQMTIARGQSVVFYQEDRVVGGAIAA